MRERKNGVIEWTMRHYQITLLVITVLVGLGILGLVDMPKQEFPEFTIRQGVVVGVYPGATSGEVEEQLAKPLERYLFTNCPRAYSPSSRMMISAILPPY